MFISLFLFLSSFSQQSNSTFGRSFMLNFEKELHEISNKKHTANKPYLFSNKDSVIEKKDGKWLSRKWNYEHFIQEKTTDFSLTLNPIINLEIGKEFGNDKTIYTNTRGIIAEGKLGTRFSFYSSFLENQSVFSTYITNSIIKEQWIVPGQGKSKWSNDFTFDYVMASGHLTYQLSKFSTLQFGHGKNFIGDGYRSLILSDVAFNYPYLRVQTSVGIIQYTNLYMQHMDIGSNPNSYYSYDRKYASLHHLSTNISDRLNVGIFESIVWKSNRTESVTGFDIQYLNPIIFYRPVEYSLNSSDNALMGVNFKYKTTNLSHLYGQFVIDEFVINTLRDNPDYWANKYGIQLGGKMYDAFKIDNLSLQAEWNFVRPYTYSHKVSAENYGHFQQALAHPLGANFSEYLFFADYKIKKWALHVQLMKAKYGGGFKSDSISYGNDIFISYNNRPSDDGIKMYQGNLTNLDYRKVTISYLINPKTNFKIETGIISRLFTDENGSSTSNFVFFALKSDLFNRYYDY